MLTGGNVDYDSEYNQRLKAEYDAATKRRNRIFKLQEIFIALMIAAFVVALYFTLPK